MSEKGGKNLDADGKFIETRHMLLIFMIVLNIVVIALCLVFLGMQLIKRQADMAGIKTGDDEYIEEIKPISYELLGIYNYQPNDSGAIGANFLSGQVIGDAEYQVIRKASDLSDIMVNLRNNFGEESTYAFSGTNYVDDEFLKSGSVIAIAYEKRGLESFELNKITRDENYYLTAIAKEVSNEEIEGDYGTLVLVKIQNIQPKAINIEISQ
jgi:hypothetical protein